ncbi:unnamed protein product [Rotaria sp. Silwood2]|nr:unnamed protein product [Rotaria sp. Silwood2]CAF2837881.1 unnamed protein product [Rotaria sp. Silwood2]CAF3000186.1 unnamed protein product [Rotaria sp. Silwood2]CAF4015210.1 unnamed protein product [Rotaria sp. Silwood2]CAF4131316.1 unnamed protein product [Rotaria sp. Silwood2]
MNMYKFLLLLLFVNAKVIDASICLTRFVPDQIRLTFAGKNGVSVGWHSYACPFIIVSPYLIPTVFYGFSPTALTFTSINQKSYVYNTQNIFKTSWFYNVELLNLQPSTVYYYKIAASNYVSASNILSFISPPTLGDQSRAVNIATDGDLSVDGLIGALTNGVCLFEQALKALQKILPSVDFFLHHGDICYADDSPLLLFGKDYEETMDYCQMAMMNITSTRFYMITVLTYSKITNKS